MDRATAIYNLAGVMVWYVKNFIPEDQVDQREASFDMVADAFASLGVSRQELVDAGFPELGDSSPPGSLIDLVEGGSEPETPSEPTE